MVRMPWCTAAILRTTSTPVVFIGNSSMLWP
jgi:hypothetical protein